MINRLPKLKASGGQFLKYIPYQENSWNLTNFNWDWAANDWKNTDETNSISDDHATKKVIFVSNICKHFEVIFLTRCLSTWNLGYCLH